MRKRKGVPESTSGEFRQSWGLFLTGCGSRNLGVSVPVILISIKYCGLQVSFTRSLGVRKVVLSESKEK